MDGTLVIQEQPLLIHDMECKEKARSHNTRFQINLRQLQHLILKSICLMLIYAAHKTEDMILTPAFLCKNIGWYRVL